MPRIPYLNEASLQIPTEFRSRNRDGKLINLDRILLYSTPVAVGWSTLLTQLRRNLNIPGNLRELVILRIGIINRASYEIFQHAPEALKEDINQTKQNALANWEISNEFDEQEQAVLAYTDAMTQLIQVPDAIYAKLTKWFNPQQIVELTTLIAGYNMVSRFLEALQITSEGE